MEASTSASTYSATRSPSPGSVSFQSAQVALPETTTSLYQQNIEKRSRTSLNERRFHAVNQLHRNTSTRSQSSITSTGVDGDGYTIAVDDEIAQGLAEEVGERTEIQDKGEIPSSDYNAFLPTRDKSRTHSILPSAAFFAPKKPPQSHSPLSPSSALSQIASSNHSPLHPLSDNLEVGGPVFRRGEEPSPLDVTGRETSGMMRGRDGSIDAASSFALGGSSSSDGGHGARRPSTNLDQHTVEAYRQGAGTVKSKASRDPLLDKTGTFTTTNSNANQSYWDQSATKRSMIKTTSSSVPPKTKRLSKQERKERVRRYKTHRGSNRFFLFGLIMTSDDNPLPFIASLIIMFALPILWFIFVAPFTWHHVSPAAVIIFAYLWAIGASSMCVTAWRDPGVLPRDLDPDPPCTAGEEGKPLSLQDPLAVPLPRIVRVRNGIDLKVKWCDTCGTYRPPRSSHCRVCDNCVENIDHHCTFLNTCIGRRNYFSFFAFLLASILSCFLAIIFSVLHIYYLTRPTTYSLPGGGFGQGKSFAQSLRETPLSAVLFLLAIGVAIPLLVLFGYHIRLISMNRTTVEQIRINTTSTYSEKPSYEDEPEAESTSRRLSCLKEGNRKKDPNPFVHRTVFHNIKTALLRPMTSQSWIHRYRYEQADTRNTNPAHLSK